MFDEAIRKKSIRLKWRFNLAMMALSFFLFICGVQKHQSERLIIAILTLTSRIPFLFSGYGSEDDSWGLIVNARLMAETGEYSYSRLPGHPVQEYILAFLPHAGVFVSNFISALFSVIAVVLFYEILRSLKGKFIFGWSLAFAFIPIIWISSTYTIDYIIALAFILASLYYSLRQNHVLAGIFIGLAIGCRLTSAIFIPGFLLLLIPQREAIIQYLLACLCVSFMCYLPSYWVYGFEFLDAYRLPYPSAVKVFYKASIGVWGFSGLIALVVGLYHVKHLLKLDMFFESRLLQSASIVSILYFTAFLVIPQKSAFLIPVVPLILMAFSLTINLKSQARTIQILLMSAALIGGVDWTDTARGANASALSLKVNMGNQQIIVDALNGPLTTDLARRENRDKYVREAINYYRNIDKKAVLLCGWWFNRFTVMVNEDSGNPKVLLLSFANEKQLDSLSLENYKIYHLREIDEANDVRYAMEKTKEISSLLY